MTATTRSGPGVVRSGGLPMESWRVWDWSDEDGGLQVGPQQGHTVARIFRNPDGEKHACLIAAAPDLLAALKGLLDDPDHQHAATDAVLIADAAIAKARGES